VCSSDLGDQGVVVSICTPPTFIDPYFQILYTRIRASIGK